MIPAPAHLNPHLTGLVHPASVFVADFLPVAPDFITVRTTYASEIWAQLTKNLLTKSGTESFRENILEDGCQMLLFSGCENFCRTRSRKYWSALDKNPPFKEAILRSQLGL